MLARSLWVLIPLPPLFPPPQVLDELSPPLRTEPLMSLNKDMVTHIPFFSDQPPAFVASVCSLLKPCFALAYDCIFREGDVAYDEMYFLQRGVIQLRCFMGSLAEASSAAAGGGGGEGGEHTQVSRQETVLDQQEAVSDYFGEVPLLIASAELQGEKSSAFDKLATHTLPDITKAFATFDIDGTGTLPPCFRHLQMLARLPLGAYTPPLPRCRHALARRAQGHPH